MVWPLRQHAPHISWYQLHDKMDTPKVAEQAYDLPVSQAGLAGIPSALLQQTCWPDLPLFAWRLLL